MSDLSRLRVALHEAASGSLHGLTFDTNSLDREAAKMRHWLGERGSAKPPQDMIVAALRAFFQLQKLRNHRQAILVCFGCLDPVLPREARLIEDGDRFPRLLDGVEAYLPNPRAFRRCYRGLLNAYFSYDSETARFAGKENWRRLRTFLRDRAANTIASGLQPAWVEGLQANLQLLGNDPGGFYGQALLAGRSEEFERARAALDIHESSWLIWQLILGQIEGATHKDDATFQQYLPGLLDLLAKHPLAINAGVAKLLTRYRTCRTVTIHPGLRDFTVAQWGNPWLSLNQAKWSLVGDDARAMVADWLKLVLIQQFFSLLAADGTNDTRRLKFWERYHDSIDDMYFALGDTTRWHRGADFQDIRKKMAGRLLNLHSAGPPDNNAFIMCIGNFVVVEFGIKGNACFIFARDRLPFLLEGGIAGNRTALKHPSFVQRLLHKDGNFGTWERTFQETLVGLMRVQPRLQPIRSENPAQLSPTPAIRLNDPAATPFTAQRLGATTRAPASGVSPPLPDPIPSTRRPAFSGSQLSRLCNPRRLRIEDLRDRNGNLWVLTDDTDEYVSSQLRSWGFAYRSGRGWWWK
jgi:EH_Signature domain